MRKKWSLLNKDTAKLSTLSRARRKHGGRMQRQEEEEEGGGGGGGAVAPAGAGTGAGRGRRSISR